MANEFYYPWYPAHYRRDAGHLDHVSDSCYRRLLDWYMESGEPIPKDIPRLMHIMSVSAAQFQSVWPQIEGFFNEVNGYLHHKRCNIELDRQDRKLKQRSDAGRRSAIKRTSQYQLLTNDRSTLDERSLSTRPTDTPTSAAREERRGEEKEHKNDASASPPALPSPRQMLFNSCLTWLAELNGKDPSKYRSIIGQWLRDHGEIRTLQVFVEAQKENPQGDRVAYMARLLMPKARKSPQI